MNAYELADEIDNFWNLDEKEMKQAANMLRQQADRIAELELIVKQYENTAFPIAQLKQSQQADRIDKLERETVAKNNYIEQQADRITELEKEADRLSSHADELRKIYADKFAKEVAEWSWKQHLDSIIIDQQEEIKKLRTTPQTKPLSDEADIEDYKVALDDVKRLTRELDVALNGDGAAQQASLCDIVCQIKSSKWKLVQTKPLSDEEIEAEPSYFGLTNDHTWLSVDEKYFKKLKPTHRMKVYRAIEAKVRGEK